MCGIFSVFLKGSLRDPLLREKAFQCSRRQRHRGPDSTGVQCGANFCIVQERLSIIGVETGRQPLLSADGTVILAANGEIFNYKELSELISTRRGMTYSPRSDSDVIMAMYEEFGTECVSMLWGMYGFIMYNTKTGQLFGARDGLGICSLYYGVDDRSLYIASEMKCIPCDKVYSFPPGATLTGTAEDYSFFEFYKPQWSNINTLPADACELVRRLQISVDYHLTSDVPLAFFLSGGLNSSIIAMLAQRALAERNKSAEPQPRLKTFAIGMEDSEDLQYARLVADTLQTDHTEILFKAEDGIDLMHELVWHLETYDPHTLRSAIPMYILSRVVRAMGIKVILSGEGADEIFGGYLYYHNAPSVEDFRQETVRRLLDVHLSDGLRANKTSMAQSVELRAPFLGSPFVNYAMTIRPEDRMPLPKDHELSNTPTSGAPDAAQTPLARGLSIRSNSLSESNMQLISNGSTACSRPPSAAEQPKRPDLPANSEDLRSHLTEEEDSSPRVEKWLLRKAFEHLLPPEVIWRQKMCFAEGVGPQWLKALESYAAERIADVDFARRFDLYPYNTPTTKEEFLYRQIFAMEYPGEARAKTVFMWKPTWQTSELVFQPKPQVSKSTSPSPLVAQAAAPTPQIA